MVSVCYILSYYSPHYVRTETLIQAFDRIDEIKLYQARNSSKGLIRYLQTILKLVRIRILHDPEYYVLGFRGYELFWLVRVITAGRVLIYDHMMSPYDSMLNERLLIHKGGILDKVIHFYERSILLASDLVLTDTDIHKQYFHELFDIPLAKIKIVPVGADENVFRPELFSKTIEKSNSFEVLYYGSFLPLHGMDVILRAASILGSKGIHFTLIGGNRMDLSSFWDTLKQLDLKNVTYIPWVEYEELPRYIAQADLGLAGPFGKTGQAGRVITGKTFQFIAMAKPVVLGQFNGVNSGFEDKINCLAVVKGDEKSLANAILWADTHKDLLGELGKRGYELYKRQYSIQQISETIRGFFPL